MIRSPLSVRLDPSREIRGEIRRAAEAGAKGLVLEATGELAPGQLSETGRRELRHLIRSADLRLVALALPTRRPFNTLDQLEDRLARAGRAFDLARDLATDLVLIRAGAVPPDDEANASRLDAWTTTVGELADRADHRGVRVALETGTEPGETLAERLGALGRPNLGGSVDPAALLRGGVDPVAAVLALGERVAHASIHQPAGGSSLDLGRAGVRRGASGLDWENYLGAFEEVGYRGFLTVWPEDAADPIATFRAVAASLARF